MNQDQNYQTITEQQVLEALGYEYPENIVRLSIQTRTCRDRRPYGHSYWTERGKQDLDNFLVQFGENGYDLEKARSLNPEERERYRFYNVWLNVAPADERLFIS